MAVSVHVCVLDRFDSHDCFTDFFSRSGFPETITAFLKLTCIAPELQRSFPIVLLFHGDEYMCARRTPEVRKFRTAFEVKWFIEKCLRISNS